MSTESAFWEVKTLDQLSNEEWEALCDGCGLCCLVKLEDEDSGEVFNTTVSCRLLDIEHCRCSDYENRFELAPMCTAITPETVGGMGWLPETCAYRRRHLEQPLPEWHYLVSGDRDAVHQAGVSVKWFATSEEFVHPQQLQDFIIERDGE
jgi:uncharacterized cysteine cluster protein YcgN (CxxCxxCC family)